MDKYNNSRVLKNTEEWKLLKRYGITIDGYRLLNEKQRSLCYLWKSNKNKEYYLLTILTKTGV